MLGDDVMMLLSREVHVLPCRRFMPVSDSEFPVSFYV